MLELSSIDLDDLTTALEDSSYEHSWWLDTETGEVQFCGIDDDVEDFDASEQLVPIQSIDSHEAFEDKDDFVSRVADRRAADLLSRAIEGRGAFRRFKDTLYEFPALREQWFAFKHGRMTRRAIEWLSDEGLVDQSEAEAALSRFADPRGQFGEGDPFASKVASDLRRLYGDRLSEVRLFGSRARGNPEGDSDVDLLVVLVEMTSPWEELRRMDDILWRHTKASGVVVTALPVAASGFAEAVSPMLIEAKTAGVRVG